MLIDTGLLTWALGGFLLALFVLVPLHFWLIKQRADRILAAEQLARSVLESEFKLAEHERLSQINHLEQQLTLAQNSVDEHAAALSEARVQLSEAREGRATALERVAGMDSLRLEHQTARKELVELREQNSQLKTELEQQQLRMKEQLSLLQDAKLSLTKEFENTANKIFDDKQQRFNVHSKDLLESTLTPLRQQLGDFRKRVDDVYSQEAAERNKLVGQVTELAKQTQKISQDAINLTNALKGDSKAQGNWGEVVLERLLEESGLQKGREYETQVSLKSEAGNRRNPDVIIRLPENKDIIIDAKVSLLDYERYCSADNDLERAKYLRAHINSMRSHISGLSFKDYENLEGIRTLDFVFIFVPIEAAFMLALQEEPALFRDAYDKHIILVSPTTLLATLRTVENIWRYEKQNRNAEKIAAQAGGLYDQFVLMLEAFDDVGKAIGRTQDAYDKARNRLKSGRGNLIKRVEDIRKLGAKTKKQLRGDLVDAALDEADLTLLEDDADVEVSSDVALLDER
ncbi:DNA recombination protein RmuC [Simiduia aestuariiviva]|uniref:DNA recombination protein RmuC n=1 Tax=Simiduia aestuariiviva TaxID=1510459 RepID=A0A839US14_9GAMM|nr:DNA recombination protein RmuC [Simiduia aestuariiviva]MBB3168187.1 DNA recombination protein RmuC [Simiduia aestuariiviva]